eukprot:COSAG06_NODE_2307_length_7109_cov_74.085877_1_plen_894_part_10
MMDALLEAVEVAGPQDALASVGELGGSFGLSSTEMLHLAEGTTAGGHRASGRARAYPDYRGVMVDEDDTVAADEDVGTAQSNTVAKLKRARGAMRKFCESEFMASRLDLQGYSEDDKEKAREIADRYNQEFSLSAETKLGHADVLLAFRQSRRKKKNAHRPGHDSWGRKKKTHNGGERGDGVVVVAAAAVAPTPPVVVPPGPSVLTPAVPTSAATAGARIKREANNHAIIGGFANVGCAGGECGCGDQEPHQQPHQGRHQSVEPRGEARAKAKVGATCSQASTTPSIPPSVGASEPAPPPLATSTVAPPMATPLVPSMAAAVSPVKVTRASSTPSVACPTPSVAVTKGRALVLQRAQQLHGISPSKPRGDCDVSMPESVSPTQSMNAAIVADPSLPYQSLYDAHFGSKLDATKAVRELGDVFALRLRPDSSAKGRGGKCGYYVCECHGCTSSLAPRGKQPFRLVLRKHMRKGEGAHGHTFHFVKDEGQHEHGYLCTATKTITPMVGHRSDVRNKVQANPKISSNDLLLYLVHELKYDLPSEVAMTDQRKVTMGNKFSKVLGDIKDNAWKQGYQAELNELAVYCQDFNSEPENGYAVMWLKGDDGNVHIYDGITGETTAVGEFVSFTAICRPTVMASMKAGLGAISVDATFLPVRPDLNLHILDGIFPAIATEGLTIVPIAIHLSFGECTESYGDMWSFLRDFDPQPNGKGVAADWFNSVVVHADRGPGCCMEPALHEVFPMAKFRSCAFHVFQAMERNCRGTCISRELFMTLVQAQVGKPFETVLSSIKSQSLQSYRYLVGASPEQFCVGHPSFESGFNSGLNASVVESEMKRVTHERKSGKSILGLVSGLFQSIRVTKDRMLTATRKATPPGTTEERLMPRAEEKLRAQCRTT